MSSVIEAVKKRYSVRTYSDKKVEEEKKQKIQEFIDINNKGPFGNKIRFQIVDAGDDDVKELKKLGTYGITNGARLYIAGAVKKGNRAMEDFGYCMEKNILKATELGIGTLWLGGSLSRSSFAERINAVEDEIIAAVTPLGYPDDKRSNIDKLIAFMSSARKRKSFEELFFLGNFNNPLDKNDCREYSEVLEAVRLAPSASNKQPWRILREKGRNVFHIYFKENSFYNSIIKDVRIQNIDMGIAMCHFELSARELGLEGTWKDNRPEVDSGDLKYITSWVG